MKKWSVKGKLDYAIHSERNMLRRVRALRERT